MCSGMEMIGIASLIGAGTGVVNAKRAGKKVPAQQQAKKPDAGVTDEERRNRQLARLAAGAQRNNPTGGTAGNPNTGSVTLGT